LQEIGKQYRRDDVTDSSGFLRRARLHQSKFRAEILQVPYDTYGNYLNRNDAERGLNFYSDFGIFDAVKKYRIYNKPLYSNMLRSEHIPFNIFIPFDYDKKFCKNVFNEFFSNSIKSIDRIEIEYAPEPKENYLNDRTSFDAYIEYTCTDNSKGAIGIEVKYTEKEYKLVANSKQEKDIQDSSSKYFSVTRDCNLYKPDAINLLPTDNFRQVWRNQILGESILLADKGKFKHFTSLTLFPKGNSHFTHISKEYINLLRENNNKFMPVTYEEFFSVCNNHYPDNRFKSWLDYLKKRYIIQE